MRRPMPLTRPGFDARQAVTPTDQCGGWRDRRAVRSAARHFQTSCMPCKRRNRRKSVISSESRQLSHPMLLKIGDILQD